MGWRILRFWGKEILKDTDGCIQAVEEAIIESIIEENE